MLLDSGQALDELAKTCVGIERVNAKVLHSGVVVVGGNGGGKIWRIRGEDNAVEEQESKDCWNEEELIHLAVVDDVRRGMEVEKVLLDVKSGKIDRPLDSSIPAFISCRRGEQGFPSQSYCRFARLQMTRTAGGIPDRSATSVVSKSLNPEMRN